MTVYHSPSKPQMTTTAIVPKKVRDMNEISYGISLAIVVDKNFDPFVLWYTGIWAKTYTRMNFMGEI